MAKIRLKTDLWHKTVNLRTCSFKVNDNIEKYRSGEAVLIGKLRNRKEC